VGFLTKMNYLSQEMQCKLQILQPLSVDGVNFCELGSESRLLERSFRRAVSRQELIGEANSLSELQNLAAGDRGAFRPFSLLLFDRLIGGEKSGLRVKAHVLEQVCPPLSLTVPVYLLRRTRWVLLIPMGLAPDSQQALFLGIWLSLGQSKCFLFFQMCLPGRDPTTWCPYCVHPQGLSAAPDCRHAQLTSSFTLAAGDCSLALLLAWLFLPFSKSRRDRSFSASSS
jgi:hypothetical protein